MNNRQAGRRRGRGGQRQGGNPGRQDNGNRIDNRARGNAAQLLEKYKNLATDAQRSGDRVSTEYYLQFADHYFRVLAETRSRMEENGQPRRPRDDDDDAEGVEDFGFEGDLGSPAHYHQQPVQPHQDSDRDDRPRRDGNRDRDGNQANDRDRDERPRQRDDQPRQRDDQPRQREDQPRQRDDQQREARPRRDRDANGDDRPRRTREPASDAGDAARPRRDREPSNDVGEDRPRREPRIYGREEVEPRPAPVTEHPVAANDEPRRRGRPRREAAVVVESEGFDAAVLPPAISVEAEPAPTEDAPPPRPRRGRPPRVRNDDEIVPPAA